MKTPADRLNPKSAAAVLTGLILLAFALRSLGLDLTFRSADETAVATRILKFPGFAWMFREYYGLLINLIVKFWAAGVSALGITLTEFWWKLPVALAGTLYVPLVWGYLGGLGAGTFGRLFGAAMTAVLPIHVMQSRYLWGYEVLGAFFLLLVLWAGRRFFEKPTRRRGAALSLAAGLYLVSHGYILPFLPTLLLAIVLWPAHDGVPRLGNLPSSIALLFRRGVWIFPVLVLPFCLYPLAHTIRKPSSFGFYLFDHLPGFVGNIGLGVVVLFMISAFGFVDVAKERRKDILLLVGAAAFYLAPLVFGTPPGVTVVRGYMLISSCLLMIAAVLCLDAWAGRRPRAVAAVAILCFLSTLWGTAESIFGRDRLFDPTLVKIERGGISPDPGSKAAGYLLRRHLDPETAVQAIHRNIEPLNLIYYFGRAETAYYDLLLEDTRLRFEEERHRMDVIICEPEQVAFVEASGEFIPRIAVWSEGEPRLWIYVRPHVSLPELSVDARELNRAFDRAFAPKVRLW